jgi:hypothetical protein
LVAVDGSLNVRPVGSKGEQEKGRRKEEHVQHQFVEILDESSDTFAVASRREQKERKKGNQPSCEG